MRAGTAAKLFGMRWDDLQLLRLIDEAEAREQLGSLMTGYTFMQAASGERPIDWDRDGKAFARELLIARDAGYLKWIEMSRLGAAQADPLMESQRWLQEISEIRLTLAGRDRARGRVIQRPLSDPEEDDDRPITGMTLEEIAREIGDTYSGSQLPRFLRDSGIPQHFIPPEVEGSKWAYVLNILEALHDGGSAARRTLREFIGSWLQGRHHTAPPPEIRERIVSLLGAQGWRVGDQQRLVVGERTGEIVGTSTPLGQDARVAALHPEIRLVVDRYLKSGHPAVAIFEAFKAINQRVRTITGLELDGSKLMGEAFSDSSPPIALADLSTTTGRDIQAGFRFMFMGAVRGIRNPDAHELFKELDPEEALETLAFASLLMRRLDEAKPPTH